MLVYNPEADAKTNYENMCGAIGEVKIGLVTYAVRDTVVDNQPIAQGDILGLYDGSIVKGRQGCKYRGGRAGARYAYGG